MFDLLHRYTASVSSGNRAYGASAYGAMHEDEMWHGFIGFKPLGGGRMIVTASETTQSSIEALRHWATGITPVYLEGALQRALAAQPEAQLERRLAELERLETEAHADALALEQAAAIARAEESVAAEKREEIQREIDTARARLE